MALSYSFRARINQLSTSLGGISRGVLVAVMVAVTAQFLSDHYGAPAMLMALLLGIAFAFLAEEGPCVAGIEFSARQILRLGVALLGARISVKLLAELGPELIALVVLGVIFTILFALLGARLVGRGWQLALLTGGSVAICGASAAMAIAAIIPFEKEHSERNLLFTVLSVTVLSTVAMIAYPIISHAFDFDDLAAGVFLGGTIHDVAQVVGAGFSISNEAGETATLVKLIRVSMLAPVVLVLSLVIRRMGVKAEAAPGVEPKQRPPLVPGFVLVFLALAAINSLGWIAPFVADTLADLSRWALLTAIAAVGMKTSLRRMLDVGGEAIALIVAETLFIASFILLGIYYLA